MFSSYYTFKFVDINIIIVKYAMLYLAFSLYVKPGPH